MSCQLPTPSALMTLAWWLFSDIPNSAHLRVSALALSSAWNASPPCSVTASFLPLTPHLQGQFFREVSLLLTYFPLPGAQSLWDIVSHLQYLLLELHLKNPIYYHLSFPYSPQQCVCFLHYWILPPNTHPADSPRVLNKYF